jgi:flagellar biosynthesis/type III secretory pathway protein FliH
MSFWTTLEADVNKGLEVASVIVGAFLPQESVLLQDILQSVLAIEQIFGKPISQVSPTAVSGITQAAVTMSSIRQASAATLVLSKIL